MPNHMRNIVQASPEVLRALIRERTAEEKQEAEGKSWVNAEEPLVDFGLLLPIPDDDDPIFTAEKTDYGNGMVGWSFGGFSPMDWARSNWGTKWNGYDADFDLLDDGQVSFDTAWSHPYPVIEALSKKFPEESITVRHADEDFGSGVGEYVILNGEIQEQNYPEPYEDEANELAADIRYGVTYEYLKAEWEAEEAQFADAE